MLGIRVLFVADCPFKALILFYFIFYFVELQLEHDAHVRNLVTSLSLFCFVLNLARIRIRQCFGYRNAPVFKTVLVPRARDCAGTASWKTASFVRQRCAAHAKLARDPKTESAAWKGTIRIRKLWLARNMTMNSVSSLGDSCMGGFLEIILTVDLPLYGHRKTVNTIGIMAQDLNMLFRILELNNFRQCGNQLVPFNLCICIPDPAQILLVL
jgi:hypothetical protein